MKIPSAFQLLAVACLALSSCASPPKKSRADDSKPIAGGYRRGGDTREFAQAAAFAAREESRRSGTPIRIVQVVKSETQVVAGTNLRLRVTALRNGATPETANVVVYRDLVGHQHLTSWRWVHG